MTTFCRFSIHNFTAQDTGVRGWNFEQLSFFHPPPPASGGENPCKSPNFVQKINALKFAKKNLTALPPKGEKFCAIIKFRTLIGDFLKKLTYEKAS